MTNIMLLFVKLLMMHSIYLMTEKKIEQESSDETVPYQSTIVTETARHNDRCGHGIHGVSLSEHGTHWVALPAGPVRRPRDLTSNHLRHSESEHGESLAESLLESL